MTTIHQAVQRLKEEGNTAEEIYGKLCAGYDMNELLDALRLAGFDVDVGPLIRLLEGRDKPLRDSTIVSVH